MTQMKSSWTFLNSRIGSLNVQDQRISTKFDRDKVKTKKNVFSRNFSLSGFMCVEMNLLI